MALQNVYSPAGGTAVASGANQIYVAISSDQIWVADAQAGTAPINIVAGQTFIMGGTVDALYRVQPALFAPFQVFVGVAGEGSF